MKIVIVGMGIQGNKRKKFLKKDFVYSVDKFKKADFKKIQDVPIDDYDSVFICVPDNEKYKIVKYCAENKKNILVEKPFILKNYKNSKNLKNTINKNKVVFYTAYNHRFEPHFIRMKNLIDSKVLGKIYSCRMFYGNGTAKLVKKSRWRDKKKGIITDIGSHLIDTCLFFFGNKIRNFKLISKRKFENKSPDHVILLSDNSNPKIELEMSYLMWKNDFFCDILAKKGSAHLSTLCKWGPSKFTYRQRKLPSGKPKEKKTILVSNDLTWLEEYKHFKNLIKKKKKNNFSKDIWIQRQINNLN